MTFAHPIKFPVSDRQRREGTGLFDCSASKQREAIVEGDTPDTRTCEPANWGKDIPQHLKHASECAGKMVVIAAPAASYCQVCFWKLPETLQRERGRP